MAQRETAAKSVGHIPSPPVSLSPQEDPGTRRSSGRSQRHADTPAQVARPRLAYAAAAEQRDGRLLPVLGRATQRRLREAVDWLAKEGPARDCGHAALVVLVVVMAKANWERGRTTSTSVPELADWLGVHISTVDKALAELRRAGAVETWDRRNAEGEVDGILCRVVVPDGHRRHPLAVLGRPELATLLRACEALFGPGWAPSDREPTPPGLLVGHTGKGAPKLRLALLRIYLDTRPDGRLRLCGGRMDGKHSRAAATVARLINRAPSGGSRVLAELTAAGVLTKAENTAGTGMSGRVVVRFPAAADPHAEHRHLRAVPADFPGPTGHPGTVGRGAAPGSGLTSQVTPVEETEKPELVGRPGTAELHAVHALGVDLLGSGAADHVVVPAEGGRGLSTVGGSARARETVTPAEATGQPTAPALDALRAEQTKTLPTQFPGVRSGQGAEVDQVLDVVRVLWAGLTTTGRRTSVTQAVRQLLATASVDAVQLAVASRYAADRGKIRDPYAWLPRRGLRPLDTCGTPGCADGWLAADAPCPGCRAAQARAEDRRALRAAIGAQVSADLPLATPEERRRETDRRTHQRVMAQQAHALAQRPVRPAGQPAPATPVPLLTAGPCDECGTTTPDGRTCGPCTDHHAVQDAADRAADAMASTTSDPQEAELLAETARAELLTVVDHALADARRRDALPEVLGTVARLAAANHADDTRHRALTLLADGPEARSEAARARRTALTDAWNASSADRRQAADDAAADAAHRAAQWLYDQRTAARARRRAAAAQARFSDDDRPGTPAYRAARVAVRSARRKAA